MVTQNPASLQQISRFSLLVLGRLRLDWIKRATCGHLLVDLLRNPHGSAGHTAFKKSRKIRTPNPVPLIQKLDGMTPHESFPTISDCFASQDGTSS
jgi:hypothetical protein